MTLEHKKIALIQEIAASSREELINAVAEVVQKFADDNNWLDLSKHTNIEDDIDVERIQSDKAPLPFDYDDFVATVENLEWDKSTEELLEELD